jgi:hypothetical protein
MQAGGWRNGCTGTQSAHSTARTIQNGTTRVLDIRRCASDTTYASNQEEARGDENNGKWGGRSREQEGCTNKHKEPRRRQHERRQRTAARRLPSRSPHARRPTNHPFAVTPPVPTTHDDERSSARHLPSRPPNTQRPTDHARAISPAVPPHARRPSDHPFAFTPPAPQTWHTHITRAMNEQICTELN